MFKKFIEILIDKAIEKIADITIDVIHNYLDGLTCGFEE